MTKAEDKSVKKWFGKNLAKLLSEKIKGVYPSFKSKEYISEISRKENNSNYSRLFKNGKHLINLNP